MYRLEVSLLVLVGEPVTVNSFALCPRRNDRLRSRLFLAETPGNLQSAHPASRFVDQL